MKPKVTIFIPIYNSISYVSMLFDSILEQNIKSIELIIIDDGSLDCFDDFFNEKYRSILMEKLYSVTYLKQSNKGQAYSLNRALKLVNGEYFTWIDSDDWLEPESIVKKLDFLESNPEYGMVRTDGFIVEQATGNKKLYSSYIKCHNELIFDDLILENNIYFCPIGYMVRTSSLFSVIPDKNIYISRGGQNWQVLLPIANKFKCGYINKPLFNYLVRGNSHSRTDINILSNLIEKYNEHHKIIRETLLKIGEYKKYEKILDKKYDNIKISVAFKCKKDLSLRDNSIKLSNLSFKSLFKLVLLKTLYKIK
ncbi:glycosyltransferase family A protein [Photobacterium leiognathi]|uniref:glycosyltransferase family A protein n=1 Tax=Photobacterium leiognathi TaxID=553611 RepID=UPI0029826419|nr:glycosyltransferase family 2 protein [Photobacterium leiognathi]